MGIVPALGQLIRPRPDGEPPTAPPPDPPVTPTGEWAWEGYTNGIRRDTGTVTVDHPGQWLLFVASNRVRFDVLRMTHPGTGRVMDAHRDGDITVVRAGVPAQRSDPQPTAAPTGRRMASRGRVRPPRDALKLAGRIALDDGETIVGSDKVAGDCGIARFVSTSRSGVVSLRLGLGGPVFGSRDDDSGPWRAIPDSSPVINAGRRQLRCEERALKAEWETLECDPNADPIRKAAVDARLTELDNTDTWDVYASGHTAKLTPEAVQDLRSALDTALATGAQLQAAHDAYWDERERLEAVQNSLRGMNRKWTDEEDARWDAATEALARLEALEDTTPESQIIAEGSVPGQWADVHYLVELDDPSLGVRVRLGAVPHDSDITTLSELLDTESAAVFDPTETKKLFQQLDRHTTESGGETR